MGGVAMRPKKCPVCGDLFSRKAKEKPWLFKRKQTCGRRRCVALSRSTTRTGKSVEELKKETASKRCVVCRGVLEWDGHESPSRFIRKTMHWPGCFGLYVQSRNRERAQALRESAETRKCRSCGRKIRKDKRVPSYYKKRKTCGRKQCLAYREDVYGVPMTYKEVAAIARNGKGGIGISQSALFKRKNKGLNPITGKPEADGGR